MENLSFEDAIKKERDRLLGELDTMLENELYYSFNHQHYSYLARGVYIEQISAWKESFPKNQLLILKSEDYFTDPLGTTREILVFLGLPDAPLLKNTFCPLPKSYPAMDKKIRCFLTDYYRPHNQRLYDALKIDFSWEKDNGPG